LAKQWTVEKVSEVCANIRVNYRRAADWEQWGLLCADSHLDNPKTDLKLKKHHLEQAKQRNAFIIEIGDLFDAMQGKGDRRSDKHDLRPEILAMDGPYLNNLVQFVSETFNPYKDNFAVIGEGNHETSVKNKLEYDLLSGLVHDMRKDGSPVIKCGYRGWIRFMFDADGRSRMSKRFYYNHGSGGGGPVTKGVIQTNRRAAYVSGADAILYGHTHESWLLNTPQTVLMDSGREKVKDLWHVQIPTYKEEFANHGGGFHHETGKPPKPKGAVWVRFYYSGRTEQIEMEFRGTEK
jgi:predicted phosphodiesterase